MRDLVPILIPFVTFLILPLFTRFFGLDLDKRVEGMRASLLAEIEALEKLSAIEPCEHTSGIVAALRSEIPKTLERYNLQKQILDADFSRMPATRIRDKPPVEWLSAILSLVSVAVSVLALVLLVALAVMEVEDASVRIVLGVTTVVGLMLYSIFRGFLLRMYKRRLFERGDLAEAVLEQDLGIRLTRLRPEA